MQKYFTIFTISWQNEFTYRLNFILWRVRNVLRFLMAFFLWKGVFAGGESAFGYSQPQIFTYILVVLFVQALITSSPGSNSIGDDIGDGNLSNYLLKPFSYFKYLLTVDVASKFLNILFSILEISLILIILKPPILFEFQLINFILFLISCLLGMFIFFFLVLSSRMIAFWTPENTWGLAFLIFIFMETLGGGIFPLDILPEKISLLLQLTPFPYFIYFPTAILIGKITGFEAFRILIQSLLYVGIMYFITQKIWRSGLKVYTAVGK